MTRDEIDIQLSAFFRVLSSYGIIEDTVGYEMWLYVNQRFIETGLELWNHVRDGLHQWSVQELQDVLSTREKLGDYHHPNFIVVNKIDVVRYLLTFPIYIYTQQFQTPKVNILVDRKHKCK